METYKLYKIKQVWELKPEYKDYCGYGYEQHKEYFMGKGNRIDSCDLNVRGFKKKGDAVNRIKVFEEKSKTAKVNHLYNITHEIYEELLYRKEQ